MKKKIEGELISIAHRLLKLKNHTETVQLHEEVKKLYEQLTLLKFYEAHTALVNEEFSEQTFEENVNKIVIGTIELDEEEVENQPEMASKEHIAQIEEELFETNNISHDTLHENDEALLEMASKEHIAQIEEELFENNNISHDTFPHKENETEEIFSEKKEIISNPEIIGTKVSKQISIDDILVHDYNETMFVKKDELVNVEIPISKIATEIASEDKENEIISEETAIENKQKNIAEPTAISKPIALGLNDKIAFEKNLFAGNADDLQRVISQLSTFTNWDEAKSFVLDFVKPDYNNWQGKEEFEVRFLEIVEKKFN